MGIQFTLSQLQTARVLYAFETDGTVRYVGVCSVSTVTLKDRMSRYRGGVGGGTNKRVAGLIKQELNAGTIVNIWALAPKSVGWKGLAVDLVKGLENPLINALKPDWNRQK